LAPNPGSRLATTPVRTGASATVLNEIHVPGVELALWRRPLPPILAAWLEAIPFERLPAGSFLADRSSLATATQSLFSTVTPPGVGSRLLIEDIEELAFRFLRLSGSALVDVRLEAVDDNACAGFHRDRVSLRLITTYRGPGTQWVAPEHAPAALRDQQAYRGPIAAFPRHAVGLFRGSRAPGAEGLTHRSPPIEGTEQTRLLLCLNLPSATSPPRWSETGH
jgi:hypothetical protein